MIPITRDDLDSMVEECERQLVEVGEIFGPRGSQELLNRPDPTKWSAAGHIAHVCVVNERYLSTLEERIHQARAAGGWESDGPYRHPRFGSWFARSMEPPPKRRLKTFKAMVPDPVIASGDALERFDEVQRRLVRTLDAARGLDLGRIRFGSPFARLVRLSLGTGLELLLAHNRRHIWLIRETLAMDDPPPAEPGRPSR